MRVLNRNGERWLSCRYIFTMKTSLLSSDNCVVQPACGASSMVFEEVVGIYLAAKTHRSKVRDLYSLKQLQPHFGGRSLLDLKRADVRGYVTLRLADGVKESTIRRELKFFLLPSILCVSSTIGLISEIRLRVLVCRVVNRGFDGSIAMRHRRWCLRLAGALGDRIFPILFGWRSIPVAARMSCFVWTGRGLISSGHVFGWMACIQKTVSAGWCL